MTVSILLYGYTTLTLAKNIEQKARWEVHKNAMCYDEKFMKATPHETAAVWPLTPISQTIQIRKIRNAEHCRRLKDEIISDVVLWTLTHRDTRVGQPTRNYLLQLYAGHRIIWRERWMIGTEGGIKSRKSVLSARLDDDALYLAQSLWTVLSVSTCFFVFCSGIPINTHTKLFDVDNIG